VALGNLVQDDRQLLLAADAHVPADVAPLLLLGPRGLEVASPQDAEGVDGHALVPAHRDDVALEVPQLRGEAALVDGEWAQAVLPGVGVRLDDEPGGRVADAEVQHLPLDHEVVEGLHQLGDVRGIVIYVDVVLSWGGRG
jgi:hypothetical protein